MTHSNGPLFLFILEKLLFFLLIATKASHQLGVRKALELHPKSKSHLTENILDFIQGLSAKVLGLEHFGFASGNQLSNELYPGILKAICRTHRKFEFIDRSVKVFIHFFCFFLSLSFSERF